MANEARAEQMKTVSERVFWLMLDFDWWTFWKLQEAIQKRWGRFYGEPTISAAIREIRKSHFRKKWQIPDFIPDPIAKQRFGKAYQYRLNTKLLRKTDLQIEIENRDMSLRRK